MYSLSRINCFSYEQCLLGVFARLNICKDIYSFQKYCGLVTAQLSANMFVKVGLLNYLLQVAANFLHFTIISFTVRCFIHLSHSGGLPSPGIRYE